MVSISTGHVGGIRGSGIVSSAADVLGMSVVRGMCHLHQLPYHLMVLADPANA